MPYNAVEEPVAYDGGCLCSLLRYRVTFPADSEYPIAKHCHCASCRKSCSSFTSTSIAVPISCLQWATRVTTSELEADSTTAHQSRVSRLEKTRGGRLWFPAPPQAIPTVGPSSSSMHRLVWRRLSAIAALDKEKEKKRLASTQAADENRDDDDDDDGDSTTTITAPEAQQDDPPLYEMISSCDGVNITPSLKIPGPYNEFESSPGSFRGFCSWCGSTMIFRTAHSEIIYIKAGTLDRPSNAIDGRFDAEWWVSNRLPAEWGLNLGAPTETGEVTSFEKNG